MQLHKHTTKYYEIYYDKEMDIQSVILIAETEDQKIVRVWADSLEADVREFVYEEAYQALMRARIVL